jgi:hypothetical protein
MRSAEIIRPRESTMTKSVTIQIATADFELLRAGNYVMCFARKVNDTYDVVWQAYSQYLTINRFSWPSTGQRLFATNSFSPGKKVIVETNAVDIGLGQQAILDAAGVLGSAANGGPSDSITLINNFGPIHPGLTGMSTGPDGLQAQLPMYVEPAAIETGSDLLKPVDVIKVWFQQDITAGTMLAQDPQIAVSHAVEVDLTAADTATRLYQNGRWSTVAA